MSQLILTILGVKPPEFNQAMMHCLKFYLDKHDIISKTKEYDKGKWKACLKDFITPHDGDNSHWTKKFTEYQVQAITTEYIKSEFIRCPDWYIIRKCRSPYLPLLLYVQYAG